LGLRVPTTSFYKKHGGSLPLWKFLEWSFTLKILWKWHKKCKKHCCQLCYHMSTIVFDFTMLQQYFHYYKRSFTLLQPWVVYTLWWLYMDVTMAVFFIFLRYKRINKIRSIKIIKKGIHLFKAIIINLTKMKKSNQNHE
jgi:hypothetical protein